ncbi:uncharacterized protein [Penaeus vannamei]|uniref:uncharacterized protein n=1 Tax=Penaeus vannamei TaxID=6689 RepID=UPI00387F998D
MVKIQVPKILAQACAYVLSYFSFSKEPPVKEAEEEPVTVTATEKLSTYLAMLIQLASQVAPVFIVVALASAIYLPCCQSPRVADASGETKPDSQEASQAGSGEGQSESHFTSKGFALPDSLVKGKGTALPGFHFKGKGTALPDSLVKGKGTALPDSLVKGKGTALPDFDSKDNGTALPDIPFFLRETQPFSYRKKPLKRDTPKLNALERRRAIERQKPKLRKIILVPTAE